MRIAANGTNLHAESVGEGEDVILIHALGLSGDAWWQQVADLARGYRVLTYDVRGHGRSDRPPGPYSLDLFAEDLRALIEALGVRRAHVVGLSLGGMIAQTYALRYAGRLHSLVLCDTSSGYSAEERQVFHQRADTAEREGMESLVTPTLERWFTDAYREANPGPVGRIASVLRANEPLAYAATCRAIAELDLTGRLAEIRVPTMVVVGEEDKGTPPAMARVIAQGIPGARLEIVRGAAHLVPVEKAEVFNALACDFLRRT